jgi:outer membrane lipoprotein SlyB
MDLIFARRTLGVAALALVVGGTAALSQPAPQRVRVRGTIEKVDGTTLTVKTRDGQTVILKLPDNVAVAATMKRTLADIKPNDFVGVAAMPQGAGKPQRALEVLIFPEAMRGTGEGHYPWDLMPESTMTNAAVAETVTSVDGATLTLKYKDGTQAIVVPPECPIVTFAPTDKGAFKVGTPIFVAAAIKAEDGSLSAPRVTVAGDVPPPM